MKTTKLILFLGILIPLILVYKNFFLSGPLAWGDAPHFLTIELKELFAEPLAWVTRGYNFGNINEILWLSPLMLLFGALNKFLGLSNDLIVRILFYFPSIILAAAGSYFFAKHLKLSNIASFFALLVYTLNTYIILLIDGGQLGVALAYGVFPIALLFLKKLMESPSLNCFFLGLFALTSLSVADPRLALVCLLSLVVIQVVEWKIKPLKYLVPLVFCFLMLNLYWLYPLLKNTGGFGDISVGLPGVPFYYPFLLYSPNWPQNLFGQTIKPPIYFSLIPVLLFAGLIFKRDTKIKAITIAFLVSALFVIGLPFIYKLPFGFAFRDTTKFFTPLMLFAGILIGNSVEYIKLPFAISKKIFEIFIYFFLLFLILPSILGKLNFVLSNRAFNTDIQKINEYLIADQGFHRSLWVPERYPTNYETNNNPALDGKNLTMNIPFSLLNASEDLFNFLYNPEFSETAKKLGIKYLILSDNPRELKKTEDNQKDWDALKKAVEENKNIKPADLNIQTPFYKVENSYPRFYAVKKLNAVVGVPLVNGKQISNSIYFEDGFLDPKLLQTKDADSISLVFNNSDKFSLAMSFLQKYFKSSNDATNKEWAVYTKDQYLKYKYELLIRGVKFTDLDYSKGIAFSTVKGEKMDYKFNVVQKGEYVLVKRGMTPSKNELNLKWDTKSLFLEKGSYFHSFENESELEILNVVGLVPKKDYDEAIALADTYLKYFKEVDKNDKSLLNDDYDKVEFESPATLDFKFNIPKGKNWLIFNDSFNQLWKSKMGDELSEGLPLYSMVNVFYAPSTNLEIAFMGQKNLRIGIYLSIVSALGLLIFYLYFSSGKKP